MKIHINILYTNYIYIYYMSVCLNKNNRTTELSFVLFNRF